MQILFIHGRAQENFRQDELLKVWTGSLRQSFANAGIPYPEGLVLTLPHYGNALIEQRDIYSEDMKSGKYQLRSSDDGDEMKIFQAAFLEDVRKNTDITDRQVTEAEDSSEQEKGWKNWRATLAIARLLDEYNKSYTNRKILEETEDVATFLVVPGAKSIINRFILEALTQEPTIIIAHSLGTVIAYEILHSLTGKEYNIKGLITLGSPLGVHAVIRQLDYDPSFPLILNGEWVNIYDKQDIVALRPLKGGHFYVEPDIINIEIDNNTENKHGIEGYLNSEHVAKAIFQILNKQE